MSLGHRARRWLWLVLAYVALGLGIVGIFLPGLPTTPFVLLAAFCFSRGSARLEAWLLAHPRFGPLIADWRARRAMPLRAKQLAWVMMAGGSAVSAWLLLSILGLLLLQIDGPPVPALPLADSDRVKEGQELAFMGFPIGGALGFSSVTHRAMVSSITQARLPSAQSGQLNERAIRGLREGNFLIFQLDATAYPGNSGGPLFDPVSGEVVGVMNMVLLKGARESALSHPSGISYAIPARHVREMMARQRP